MGSSKFTIQSWNFTGKSLPELLLKWWEGLDIVSLDLLLGKFSHVLDYFEIELVYKQKRVTRLSMFVCIFNFSHCFEYASMLVHEFIREYVRVLTSPRHGMAFAN